MTSVHRAALTGAVTSISAITVPQFFHWCNGFSGPPGFVCIGNFFVSPWVAMPIGIALVCGAAALIAWIWKL